MASKPLAITLTKAGIPSRRGCRPGTPMALNLHKKHPVEYRTWGRMRSRCNNPRTLDWPLYGGRGIAVCARWDSFANFLDDMGERPAGHSIDRIDGDGNYEPDNCRWATAKEQARNWKTRNRRLTFGGETLLLVEWAERIGLTRESLRDRIGSGWPLAKALTTPPMRKRERAPDGTFA